MRWYHRCLFRHRYEDDGSSRHIPRVLAADGSIVSHTRLMRRVVLPPSSLNSEEGYGCVVGFWMSGKLRGATTCNNPDHDAIPHLPNGLDVMRPRIHAGDIIFPWHGG